MTNMFTDEEMRKMQFLPYEEQTEFYRELGAIQMNMRIADAVWEKTREALEGQIDKLIDDIHKRLENFEIRDCHKGCVVGTEEYHPNRKDFEDAHAQTNPKVPDRETVQTVSPAGKEGKGAKR